MACGIPVVATKVGGTPEIVLDHRTGYLVERQRPDLLAQRIVELARDPQLRERMGLAGSERVRDTFNIEKNALQVEECLLNA